MGTDSKTAVQQPSSKVTIVSSSSSSSKNIKKKKSKTSHHKSKHNKQQRSESSSSRSSNDYERNPTTTSSSSKKSTKTKNSKDKTKVSSSNETRNNDRKSSSNKKKSHRSKHESSESPKRTRSRSKSRSRSDRSSDRSSSRESPSRYRHKNFPRRSNSNMQNVYSPMSHGNFPPNMPRHYMPPGSRGGRMPYMPPGMMGGPGMRNHNGNRRSGGNSPPQSLLGGYRPPLGNFRGRGNPMNNPAYVHNMANMLNLLQQQQQQQQQKQKPNSNKYANPNNPHNRFYQQFQDNYKKISQGQKVSNLYQASFPVQHIPREMRFNFRLLGRNIFTASDEEEEEAEKAKKAAAAAAATSSSSTTDKRSKQQRRDSSSSSDSASDDDRRKRRGDDDDDDDDTDRSTKSKSSPSNKTQHNEQKRSSTKTNRNRTSSSTATQHTKTNPQSHELLTDTANLTSFLADMMQNENPELFANTLVTAAAAVNSKRERTKKQEKKVQKFKNYARFQQIQAAAGGVIPATNPEEVEKKIHGLARRLQMKTIGLHDDYEQQGIKRSDESSGDSDGKEGRRRRSSGSSTDPSKDKDAGSDASTNSQRQKKLKKTTKRTNKKMNAAGQLVGSTDDEQNRSDGNDSDGSMLNLNEDLKPIGYYIKDRERMLHEMFRCVRGYKLQAILPDVLKTRSLDEIKAKCLDQLDILSKKRIRAILLAQPMTSSSGTEDSTDDDEQDFFTLYPHLKSSLDPPNNNTSNAAVSSNTSATTTPSTENTTNKKSLPNSKFRPVPMQVVTETFVSNLAAPVVVRGDEDVNDYYEGFKQIKKLASLRRNEQDDDFLPFPDQSGKLLQPFGSTGPRFEFKPITGLTHTQQAHLIARRAANRQQQQQIDVRQEIDDLLSIDDFVLPNGERPLSSAELSTSEQRRYGLPPRLQQKIPAGPPKKGSLGDLLKQKNKQTGERSPSPLVNERNSKRRRRSQSLSSTGSRQWSRSSSLSDQEERISRHSSREITSPVIEDKKSDEIDNDLTDMNDLSKLLDLNEEDELLLLQIEVEQEERNMRREEKRRRKGDKKKNKKSNKQKTKSLSLTDTEDMNIIIQECLNDIIDTIINQQENKINNSKRTFDQTDDVLSKKIKLQENV